MSEHPPARPPREHREPPGPRAFFGMTPRQWRHAALWAIAGFVALGLLLRGSATAREVLGSTGWALFTFFTTPFILEASVALLGLCLVVTWNNRRIEREGDGWVTMEVDTAHRELEEGPDQPS